MTDKTDLIREIHEYVTTHGGENTATHLLVQAASVIQTQAAELEAVGAGGVQALSAAPGAAFEVADALADSQYLAGVSAGWNAANADDPNEALRKLHESRAGYLKPLDAASTHALRKQAAPKAAPTLPEGWTACTIEFGNDGPEEVAYGPKRMMTRLAKWLGKYFAQVIAEAAPKAAPGEQNTVTAEWLEQAYREGWAACRDAETIGEEAEDWAFGNSTANSRMIDEQQAAPQQEAQEPVGKYLTVVYRDLTRDEAQALIDHEKMSAASWSHALHERDMAKAAPQQAPAPLSDAQIKELIEDGVFLGNCKEIVRAIEHAHGITQKGGSNAE